MLKIIRKCVLKLIYSIRNIRIQTRLIGAFFTISLLPLIITGALSYSLSSSAIKSKISTYSIQIADQVSKNIERELSRLEFDSVDLALSESVQETLANYSAMSEYERYNSSLILQENVVKKFSFLHYISDVLLYTNDRQRIVAYGDSNMFKFVIEPVYLKELLIQADNKGGAPVWAVSSKANEVHLVDRPDISFDSRYGILICRSIKDLSAQNQTGYRSSGKKIGYIVIRANEAYISDIFRNIDIGEGSDIIVVDSEGVVVSSRSKDIKINEKYKNGEIKRFVDRNHKSNAGTVKFDGDNEYSLITSSPIEGTDWFVVNIVPFSYLNAESIRLGTYILLVCLACILTAVVLSFFISKSISMPLRALIRSMNRTKNGNLSVPIVDTSKDEIAEVTSNYNAMLENLKMLLEDIKNKERQKRKAELKALQAQINPHFLSNTLNTAKWLAGVQNAHNVEELLTSLIELLHASMGKGDEMITVEEELNYLKNYISIQEFKYYDKFKVHFDIQPGTHKYKILKFILQPLLENSIIHGIEPLKGTGVIVVKINVEDDDLKIRITDNGVGISEDIMKDILTKDHRPNKSKLSGIGLPNVEERIQLAFGEKYGIRIESVPNLFTTFELTLPIITQQ
jgi:two-component system sensor histidine kinase YesM